MMETRERENLGEIISFKPQVTYNNTRTTKNGRKAPDGIEIRFGTNRPTLEVREKLKAHGFQFSERQILWYALDNPKARELANYFENNDIQADDTQYEKRHFWTAVRSMEFYHKLSNYTEFIVGTTPPLFYKNKKQLESRNNVASLIHGTGLKFKKFYNKKVGEEDEEESEEESQEEENEEERDDQEQENENEEDDFETEHTPPVHTKGKTDDELATKLEDLAKGMEKQVQAKLHSATSRQRPTSKRLRVAAGMRSEGYYLLNIQNVLYALAKAYKIGIMHDYPYLQPIRSKKHVELLNKYADVYGRKHEDHYLDSVFKNNSSEFQNLGITSIYHWSLAFNKKESLIKQVLNSAPERDREQARKVEEQEMKIKGMKIPGFFPTLKPLIQRLIRWADIQKGQSVLEPSAGKGDILDALKEQYGTSITVSACELHYELRELLKLKGYETIHHNFLEVTETFDRIIMNPPFEKGQDITHVLHAYSLLNKGGRLVAIMGEGAFFRSSKKDQEFRAMLQSVNAYQSERIEGAFKEAFNQTGIAVRIVVMNQDGSYPTMEEKEYTDTTQNQELTEDQDALELEALVEMELLKMELELKQKQKRLNGLEGIGESTPYPAVWDIR